MLKRLMTLGTSLLLLVGLQAGLAPAARADELTSLGATLSWNPAQFRVPESCEYLDFSYRSPAKLLLLRVNLVGPRSGLIKWDSVIGVDPGRAGSLPLHVCSYMFKDGFGPYEVVWEAKAYNGDTEVNSQSLYFTPPPPTGLVASAVEGLPTSVDLSWSAPRAPDPSGIEGYRVRWSGGDMTVSGTKASIDSLPPATNITFTVTTLGAGRESTPAEVSFQTGLTPVPRPPLPPEDPFDVRLTSVGSRTITVAWQPPPIAEPPVTGYQVSVAGGSTVSTAGTSARITGLSPRTSYTVTVKAINTKGASLGVRLLAVTDKDISEPRNLTSLPVSSKDSVRLAWLPPLDNGGSPIREYRISWNAGGDVKTQVASDTAATIAGLKTGTRYTFEVRAINTDGDVSPAAAITVATSLDPQPRPDRPNRPLQVRVAGTTATSVAVDWDAALPSDPPVTGYLVSVKGVRSTQVAATSVLITDLQPEQAYEVTVQSVSTGGASDAVTVWAKTAPGARPAPAPFTPTNPSAARPVNTDGSQDGDGRPATLRQTSTGKWPAKTVVRVGVPLPITKKSGLVTNAGQTAQLLVTATSPSVKKVVLKLNPKTKAYTMTVTLKKGKVSGSVTLTVSAPAATVNGARYEPMLAAQKFTVRR